MASKAASSKTLGRRIATVLVYGVAAFIGVMSAVELSVQAFRGAEGAAPYASCREGLRALASAIDRARSAASSADDAEDHAIERFRSTLESDWQHRDRIAAACQGSPSDERALDAIERLRYAEEHAVRREAGDLLPLRRRVQAIVDELPSKALEPKRNAPPVGP